VAGGDVDIQVLGEREVLEQGNVELKGRLPNIVSESWGALTFWVHSAGAAPPLTVHMRKPVQLTKSVGRALVLLK
jgi:hypothetical protein